MVVRLLAALSLAADPALAQQAPEAPAERPSGTVFFPGVLVRPDGRPAHLNEAPVSGRDARGPNRPAAAQAAARPSQPGRKRAAVRHRR